MKEKRVFHAIGSVNDKFIEEMYAPNEAKKKTIVRHPAKKLWLIAAIITAMVFMMGCAIVYALKMENLWIADSNGDKLIFGDDGMTIIGTESVDQQVLTLAGLKGTAGYQAAIEWYEFKQEYDPDHTVYAKIVNDGKLPEFPDEYDGYSLYSQEMKNALDSILEKNGLTPQGAILNFRTVKNMCEALGVDRIQTTENNVSVNVDTGGCFESGNFHLVLKFDLPDAADNEIDNTSGTLMWNRKDCFSEDMVTIEATGDWQEWNYTTTSGYQTLIIRSESDSRGWIVCDRGEAILALQIEAIKELWNNVDGKTWTDKLYLTDRQMEEIADAVDFGIQPRVATQEDVKNQPQASGAATQDGYTVELKSVVTDGTVAHITLRITAPEGTVISRTTREGHENEPYHIDTANFDRLIPIDGKVGSGSAGMNPKEDGDGLDNTQDFVIEAEMSMLDGSKPFAIGSTWTIRLEDLIHTYYDTERYTVVEELLAEGEWIFLVTIDESNGDQSEIEFVGDPIVTKAVTGFKADGTDVYNDVTVTSFSLHGMSATVLCEGRFAPEITNNGDRAIYVVMKDGSKIQLYSSGGAVGVQYLTPEKIIDLEQVDHILLADGTSLFVPQ
ncbi:MAG: hypothetical protein J6C98_07915 [Oscillospiraceae bacterium]|nr:hypothetical protein [Oscillospiraceae bacterium]